MTQAEDSNKVNFGATLLIAIVTMFTSIAGSYFVMRSEGETADATTVQVFMTAQIQVNISLREEIRKLKEEVQEAGKREAAWRSKYIAISLEKLDIEKQMSRNKSEKELMTRWIEDMPFEAWAKSRNEEGELEIVAVNERFTSTYGLTKAQAIGKTDMQLFPAELARIYLADDEEVARTGVPLTSINEYVLPSGKIVKMEFTKYRIKMSDGSYGVGGIVITRKGL